MDKTLCSDKKICSCALRILQTELNIPTGKRKATLKFCHVLHVAHNYELHKLTMTRILSQVSGYFNLSILFTRYVG